MGERGAQPAGGHTGEWATVGAWQLRHNGRTDLGSDEDYSLHKGRQHLQDHGSSALPHYLEDELGVKGQEDV